MAWAGATPAQPTPQAETLPSRAAAVKADTADAWLRLDSPARQNEVVTTPTILVRGEAGPGVTELWIGLESRTGKVLVSRTVERDGPMSTSTAFEQVLRLGSARTTGRLFVTVTAIGGNGVPTHAIRRRVETRAAAASQPPS